MPDDNSSEIDYGSIVPDFTEKEVQDSAKYLKAEPGIYLWRTTSAVQAISKADKPTAKGWYMVAEEWTALRPSDRAPSMLSVRTWTLLPLMPNPIGLSQVGYEGSPQAVAPDGTIYAASVAADKKGYVIAEDAPAGCTIQWTGRIGDILATFDPDGGQKKLTLTKFKDRMRAFQNDSVPRVPDKKTVSKEAFEAARTDQIRVVKTFARELFRNPGMLVSTEHYANLYFEKEQNRENGEYIDKLDAEGKPIYKEFPSVSYPRALVNPHKTKEGSLKPVLDPFLSYK